MTPYTSIDQLPVARSATRGAAVPGISRSKAHDLFHARGDPTLRIGRRLLVPKAGSIRRMDRQTGGAA